VWKSDKVIFTGNNKELGKTSPSATLSTKIMEWTALEWNPALGDKRQATKFEFM
jgi:hypothetical protein